VIPCVVGHVTSLSTVPRSLLRVQPSARPPSRPLRPSSHFHRPPRHIWPQWSRHRRRHSHCRHRQRLYRRQVLLLHYSVSCVVVQSTSLAPHPSSSTRLLELHHTCSPHRYADHTPKPEHRSGTPTIRVGACVCVLIAKETE
jgi:hypothetical protein